MHPTDRIAEPLALFDRSCTRALEARALAALPAHALMRRAGAAVARLALAIAPHARRIWVAAGPGNNGGDGLEAAAILRRTGKDARAMLIGDRGSLPADAADALARAQAVGVPLDDGPDGLDGRDLAIDALLGIGATRVPEGRLAESVHRLNALACPVLAVDVPSGLNVDTGRAYGETCVVAHHTLALLTLKPGLFTAEGRDHAGRVWLDRLGIEDVHEAEPVAWLRGVPTSDRRGPLRRHAAHKGSFGDLAVVGGAAGMVGAAILAARAAHAAGAGRVYVVPLNASAAPDLDGVRPELMFRAQWCEASPPNVIADTVVVCGCGGGDAVRAPLPRLLSLARRLVLDADALNAIAADRGLRTALALRAPRGLLSVLTPHPLEAARLLDCSTAQVQADRLGAARELAARHGAIVVLKGSGSIIAAPGLLPVVNATGNAALASAGTGDVLAGWIGGRWAPAAFDTTLQAAFDRVATAVAEHGAAVEPQPAGPMRAADLVEALHRRLGSAAG
jgi:hydroxyethylthiazole kinase-like uncharacterized protein yjeF